MGKFDSAFDEKKHPRGDDGRFIRDENDKPKTGKMSTSDLIDTITSGSSTTGNQSFADLDIVNSFVAEKVKQVSGVDVSGFKHSIDEAAIRHIFSHHGNESNEKKRGQVAVTKADIENLNTILKHPDSIEYSGTTGDGKPIVIFKKKIDNLVVCVHLS